MAEQRRESAAESDTGSVDGVAGARRRAEDAGARTASGRARLREMTDGNQAPEETGAGSSDRGARAHEWTAQAQDRAARMHDSAAALHEHAAFLGIGDEQDHRRRADHHRTAAQSNRPRRDGIPASPPT